MTRTTFATQDDQREASTRWRLVDASGQVLGRMASAIAEVLMGKRNPKYTPHILVGDGVIVVNAEKVAVTGDKATTRTYTHYTGHAGGLRERSLGYLREHKPEELITLAVRRMLPKTKLGAQMLKRLKVYRGPHHPHVAQKPTEWQPETR